ncbi:hypothetical protein AUEXF2481DRAFT_44393 [Aureobasidium subglaciale EXF-2481]|uniref:Uncharacterized protein n=1 Tax=Aureobasidium subglaciale (strain EXF-2481) TaxID=1043005 RepID=A0A074Y083_AURSE|nr:uncharacterized protein AUEXF2481DRAFT_44393 [Aureobasidium subglaciale EXF-2481]KEQ91193.1 hypothetical protein AUEXF2481DRAFT_44393 [Aureobasidium subglaciale EXF-2481]
MLRWVHHRLSHKCRNSNQRSIFFRAISQIQSRHHRNEKDSDLHITATVLQLRSQDHIFLVFLLFPKPGRVVRITVHNMTADAGVNTSLPPRLIYVRIHDTWQPVMFPQHGPRAGDDKICCRYSHMLGCLECPQTAGTEAWNQEHKTHNGELAYKLYAS